MVKIQIFCFGLNQFEIFALDQTGTELVQKQTVNYTKTIWTLMG